LGVCLGRLFAIATVVVSFRMIGIHRESNEGEGGQEKRVKGREK
jgi:hypothetical protein